MAHPLTGTVSQSNAVRIEQVSPDDYRFAGGGIRFTCNRLIAYNFPNNSSTTYHTALVQDYRNGVNPQQYYRVRKLADGRCWMIDNLKLAGVNLTSANSDITASTYVLPNLTTENANDGIARVYNEESSCPATSTLSGYVDNVHFYHPHSQTGCGYMYNWHSATAGTGTFSGFEGESTTVSICPFGWKLPRTTSANELQILDAAMNAAADNIKYYSTNVYNWHQSGAFSGVPAGVRSGSNSNSGIVTAWTSAEGSRSGGNYFNKSMEIYNAVVYTEASRMRYIGLSLRCVME